MNVTPLPHRHAWEVMSTHPTSQGRLRYEHCACGQWQITMADEVDVRELATPASRRTARPAPGPA